MAGTGRGIRRRYVLLLLVLTAITLITLDQRRGDAGPLGAVGRAAHDVVAPVRSATDAVVSPVSDWFGGIGRAGTLKEDNDRLRREVAEMQAQVDRAQDAIRENQQLHALLELDYPLSATTIAAQVVSPATGNFEQTVVIDRGSDDGLRVDMPVVASGGLYGRVTAVSSHQATVLLLTDRSFSVSVRTASGRITAIASGRNRSTMSLSFVERTSPEADLAVGDAVVTSGLEASLFPPGIPVGQISTIDRGVGDEITGARLRPVVDVDVVEFVLVVDPSTVTVPEAPSEPAPGSSPATTADTVADGADVTGLTTTTSTPG